MKKQKKSICANCKHGGTQFKIGKLTHLHCEHPDGKVSGVENTDHPSPFDTVREFGNTCSSFELR